MAERKARRYSDAVQWFLAFLFTIAVEIPIAGGILSFRRSVSRVWLVILLTHCISHPTLWFVLLPTLPAGWGGYLAAEAIVWTFEAMVYSVMVKPRDVGRAVAASVVANAVSFGVGELV